MPINGGGRRDTSREEQFSMLFKQNLALKFSTAKGMLVLCLCIATMKVLLRIFQSTFVSGSLEKILILIRIAV